MGRGIAQIFAQCGHRISLLDAQPQAAATAQAALRATWESLALKGRLQPEEVQTFAQRLELAAGIEALGSCDLVIEAIVERLDVKRELVRQLEAVLRPEAIIASNTSSLSIAAIAAGAQHPERIAGFHFFNPVPLMKVVEVIQAHHTSTQVAQTLLALGRQAGHTAVLAKDMPGFIVNHAGRGFGTEALKLVGERVADFPVIDALMREQVQLAGLGFRMGPFELMDLTGLDVSQPVMESVYRQFYDEPRFRPSALAAQRLAAGVLGRKTGQGFYQYDASGKPASSAATAAVESKKPRSVWVDPRADADLLDAIRQLGPDVNCSAMPAEQDLCIFLPQGEDLSQRIADLALGAFAAKSVALDTFFAPFAQGVRRRCVMRNPATSLESLHEARALFSTDQVAVDIIEDSIGFVAPRVVSMIVAIGCEIAQQNIASPTDIDQAVRLGLGYPLGPLAMGDAIGPAKIVAWLQAMEHTSGDARYRPSLWLRRRAQLGLSLLHV